MRALKFWTGVRDYATRKVDDAYMARYGHARLCPNCKRWTSQTMGAAAVRDEGPVHEIMTCAACDYESRWRMDNRHDYGEERLVTVGHLAGRMMVVCWTPRGDDHHVFSMRKANAREQKKYASLIR